jgi:hypothetical protein
MMKSEEANVFPDLMNYSPDFFLLNGTAKMRMYVINKMFEVAVIP